MLDKGVRTQKNCTTKAYLLIPAEFGGGYYFVNNETTGREYDGYGNFFDALGIKHDAYEELAKWNGLLPEGFDHKDRNMVQTARMNAIEKYYTPEDPTISFYEDENYNSPKILKYPLKSTENPTTYEKAAVSTDDRNEGWGDDYDKYDYDGFDDDDDDDF